MSEERKINLNVWPIRDSSKDPAVLFPEQHLGYVKITPNSVGLACSGGGARSLVLTSGYFRALRDLGLQENISYISSVSGGTWASSIFTYAEEPDSTLLGASIPPESCSLRFLKRNDPGSLPKVVTGFFGVTTAILQLLHGVERGTLWQRMIGHTLLRKFGLEKKIFLYNEQHASLIKDMNKDNKFVHQFVKDFIYPRKGKPFLIMNSSLGGPRGYSSGWGTSLQCTPLYTGVPFYRDNSQMPYVPVSLWGSITGTIKSLLGLRDPDWLLKLYRQQIILKQTEGCECRTIGGGVIDTFAFGTKSLCNKEDYYGKKNCEGILGNTEPFYLEDAVGASSAAYVTFFENKFIGLDFNPSRYYFPVYSKEKEQFKEIEDPEVFCLADGGNYENTGLLPLIQRGLSKMICFINCSEPLVDLGPGVYSKDGKHAADTQLLSLFGAVEEIDISYNYFQNQVFEKKELQNVLEGLRESKATGKGAVLKKKLKLRTNVHWNIRGGKEVEVLFVYNELSDDFKQKLPQETQDEIGKKDGDFDNFPFYNTTFQDRRPFSLNIKQVNLGTAHAEYVLKANEDLVRSMFG